MENDQDQFDDIPIYIKDQGNSLLFSQNDVSNLKIQIRNEVEEYNKKRKIIFNEGNESKSEEPKPNFSKEYYGNIKIMDSKQSEEFGVIAINETAKRSTEILSEMREHLQTGMVTIADEIESMKKVLEIEQKEARGIVDNLKTNLESEKLTQEEEILKVKTEIDAQISSCKKLEIVKNELQKLNLNLVTEKRNRNKQCKNNLSKTMKDIEAEELKQKAEINKLLKQKDKNKEYLELQTFKLTNNLECQKKYGDELVDNIDSLLKTKQNLALAKFQAGQVLNKNTEFSSEIDEETAISKIETAKLKKDFEIEKKCQEAVIINLHQEIKTALDEKQVTQNRIIKIKSDLDWNLFTYEELEKMKNNLEKNNEDLKINVNDIKNRVDGELHKIKELSEQSTELYKHEITILTEELKVRQKCCENIVKVKEEVDNKNSYINIDTDLVKIKKEFNNKKINNENELLILKKELKEQRAYYSKLEAQIKDLEDRNKELINKAKDDKKKSREKLAKVKNTLYLLRCTHEDELKKLKKDIDVEINLTKHIILKLNIGIQEQNNYCKELKNIYLALEKNDVLDMKLKNIVQDLSKRELIKCKIYRERSLEHYVGKIGELQIELELQTNYYAELEEVRQALEKYNIAMNINVEELSICCQEDLINMKEFIIEYKKLCEEKLNKLKNDIVVEKVNYENGIVKIKQAIENNKIYYMNEIKNFKICL